ncbi:MAG: tetratricopeptide repeat protein [Dysgonamonadaceae bacterium]|jgi:tetratricopeptide (TPR) repeat protein|nr:tetratricopeptide repeat protein [Dysgonamonadaceae bacterium]
MRLNKIVCVVFYLNFALFCYAGINKQREILEQFKQIAQKEYESNRDMEAAIFLLDSLISATSFTESEFISVVNRTGEVFHQQGNLIPVIELFSATVNYYKQYNSLANDQVKSLISLLIPLGAAYEELGMWNRAADFYREAIALAEERHLENIKALIYNNIGAIHYNHGELDKAEEYFQKAIVINEESGNKIELFNNYNNLGGVYVMRRIYDKALDCALLAIQQLNREQNANLYYFMQTNIAHLHLLKKDMNLAFSYLNNSRNNQENLGFNNDLVQTYLMLSKASEEIGQKDSARLYMEKAVAQARRINNKYIESHILSEAAHFYKRNGQIEKAYPALQKATEINDSILLEDNRQKISNMERMYIAEKKNRENEMEIKNITLQKLASDRQRIIFVTIAIFLIVAVLYLINYSKTKERERKKEELLLLQQKELHRKEQELQKQKEQELSSTIELKNRELTSFTLSLTKNSEFITDLIDNLKRLSLEVKEKQAKESIRMIINKLSIRNSTDNWEEFSYYFEKVHPSFYQNLEKQYSGLTVKEKRLCALLHLGLSSKEIAAITFKEVRSVESARNRLRKRLGVGQEQNLTEFIQNIR